MNADISDDRHLVTEPVTGHKKVRTLQEQVRDIHRDQKKLASSIFTVRSRLAGADTVPLGDVQQMAWNHDDLHLSMQDLLARLGGEPVPAAAVPSPRPKVMADDQPAAPVPERRVHKRMSKEEQLSQDLQDLKKPPEPADTGDADEQKDESGETKSEEQVAEGVAKEPEPSPKVEAPPQPKVSWVEKAGLTELMGFGLEKLTEEEPEWDFSPAAYRRFNERMAKFGATPAPIPHEDEPPPKGDPPKGAPPTGSPSSPPPTGGPAAPPSSTPASQAAPDKPNARLGVVPLCVVAGAVANVIPMKDNGIEYRPDPVPPGVLPFALPEDWGRAPYKAPILRIAAIAGCKEVPRQLGLIGLRYKTFQPIAIDLDGCGAFAYFGVPGYGKSYAMALQIEMALQQAGSINKLLAPQCAVVLHHHPSASYEPEMLASVFPNQDPREACKLVYHYRALPRGLPDVLVLTLPEQVKLMRKRHRHAQVHGIKFSLRDLGVDGLRILLGLDRSQKPLYMSQVQGLLKKLEALGGELTFARLIDEIDKYPFRPWVKGILVERLRLVRDWIDDSRSIRDFIKPGRLIQIDIRSEWLPSEDAMVLFRLLTSALVMDPDKDQRCNLVVAYDEAHKFAKCLEVRRQMTTMVRERRHLRISLVLASQDPLSIPEEIIALLDGIGVFRHESSAWNKHLAKSCAAFSYLKTSMTEALPAGMMWFWSRQWCMLDQSEGDFHHRPILVDTRPRLSHHGGATKKATEARGAAVA